MLRQALADYHRRHFAVALDVERITAAPSGMNAIMLALQAVASQGDNILVVTPCWPNIFGAAQILGVEARCVEFRQDADGSRHLDLDALSMLAMRRPAASSSSPPAIPPAGSSTAANRRRCWPSAGPAASGFSPTRSIIASSTTGRLRLRSSKSRIRKTRCWWSTPFPRLGP